MILSFFTLVLILLFTGCGLDVLNPPPLQSLSQLLPGQKTLSMEHVAALTIAHFEPFWHLFLREQGSFEPFIKLYLDRWMHSWATQLPSKV
jgi:biotin---protein ligase